MEITLDEITGFINKYDDESATLVALRRQVLDLTSEVDAIKQDAEQYAVETSATKTGTSTVKKDYLAKHDRYNTAVAELRQAQNDQATTEALVESSRMHVWARIAVLQGRKMTMDEIHNHPVDESVTI